MRRRSCSVTVEHGGSGLDTPATLSVPGPTSLTLEVFPEVFIHR